MTSQLEVTHDIAPVEEIRKRFPALERRHAGHPVAYFDGPGGTQVPREVVEAMTDYLYHHNANTHWNYPTSAETDTLIADARDALASFFNARPDEVAFGNNMTTLTFHIARALGRGWGPGDEVVVTELDHHANIAPWRALQKERGVTVRTVPFDPATGLLDWDALSASLNARTRLLALGAASNALGTINDVKAATKLARCRRALLRGLRAFRVARRDRRRVDRLRLPGVLAVQILRSARRCDLCEGGRVNRPGSSQARPGA